MKKIQFYVASCHEKGGIYLCETDGASARVVQFFPVPSPMYLERAENTLYVVLRGEQDNSALARYELSASGEIKDLLSLTPTGGKVGCHLAVSESGVFVPNYTSGSVFRTPDILVTHDGHSIHPIRQTAPHPHATVLTPDKKYVCVADLGLDSILIYDLSLRLVSRASVPAGYGARHMIFSPCGKWLYVLCELTGHLCVFRYENGVLKLAHSLATLPSDFTGNNLAAAIRLAGDKLYVSHRGHDSIAVLDIATEKPALLTHVSCEGNGPRDFNLFGDLLIVTNEKSDNLSFFCLKDGIPEKLPFSLGITAPLCVI